VPRRRPGQVKEEVVRRRGFANVRLVGEQVAEFNYRPAACREEYLMIVVRKQLVWERHGQIIGEETRYFFHITNQWLWSAAEVVSFANDRCNQENLIAQLKSGVRALRAPSNTLLANGAYMVIGALAWNLKAWLALVQPCATRARRLLTMEFRTFLAEVMLLPCQIVRAGRRLVYRLLQWNPWVDMLCALGERLRQLHLT
jgi:Transposase DDE domain group 1